MKVREMKGGLSIDSIVKRDPEQAFSTVDDEIVMLSLNNGEYYTLNDVASRIWIFIDTPKNVSEIIEELMREYEVDYEVCAKDTMNYLKDLGSKNLLNYIDA